MEGSTRPRVSLVKPNREPADTFVGRSFTPVHIREEYVPGEDTAKNSAKDTMDTATSDAVFQPLREFTPEHIAAEPEPVYSPVERDLKYAEADAEVMLDMCLKGEQTPEQGTVHMPEVGELTLALIDDDLTQDLFSGNIYDIRIGKGNRIVCFVREKRDLVNKFSPAIDKFQNFLTFLTTPNVDFYAVYELLGKYSKAENMGPFKEFYAKLLDFCELIYHDDASSIITLLRSRSYVNEALFYKLKCLAELCDISSNQRACYNVSAYVFKHLGEILKKETCFKVNPLFIFVCENMAVTEMRNDKNLKFSEDTLKGLSNSEYQITYHRANLEACGRASNTKRWVPMECSKLTHLLDNLSSPFALISSFFIIVGILMIMFDSALFMPALCAIGCSAAFGYIPKIAAWFIEKNEIKRAITFRALGLADFSVENERAAQLQLLDKKGRL